MYNDTLSGKLFTATQVDSIDTVRAVIENGWLTINNIDQLPFRIETEIHKR